MADSDLEKQKRWPSGAPGGKGGQFAPSSGGAGGGKFSGMNKIPGFTGFGPNGSTTQGYTSHSSKWSSWNKPWPGEGEGASKPIAKPIPASAKPHPKTDDNGKEILVHYPPKPSGPETWTDPKAVATFTPGSDVPDALNGVAFAPWTGAPKDKAGWARVPGQNPALEADDPFEPHPEKYTAAGVIIQEPDGRVWVTEPTNHFGGYKQTFPKGTAEPELSLQANAIKEAYEETGLQVRITGVAGDFEKTTSYARFYTAERIGGTPKDMGWESQAIKLAPKAELPRLLNRTVDRDIVAELDMLKILKRRGSILTAILKAQAQKKGSYNDKQPRWPAGSPLGGQWKTMSAGGLTLPPKIAGGLEGKNSSYYKKAQAAFALASGGKTLDLVDAAMGAKGKAEADKAAGKKSSHVKWHAQLSQYMDQLVTDTMTKPKAEAAAVKATGGAAGVMSLSTMKKVAPKPGGSNPGGLYTDADGKSVLVKGNKQLASGAQTEKVSNDRARNEVLAAKLMQAAGVGAPDMTLVALEGQYGGGLGVGSYMVEGAVGFDPKNKAHVQAAREDFAVQAWLANYDVLGMGFDNTVIKDGKAVNIDPGGALLFRAQGALKDGGLSKDAPEFETMRKTSDEQKAVYVGMSKSELQASAKKLAMISDDTIKAMVDAYGPQTVMTKDALTATLIARKNAILTKAGVTAGVPPQVAPAPEPPKVAEAVVAPTAAGSAPVAMPNYTGLAANTYKDWSEQAKLLHDEGAVDQLKTMLSATSNLANSKNGKTYTAYLTSLVADLELSKQEAAGAVAAGKQAVTGSDGTSWTGDGKGVLQPVTGGVKALSVKEFNALKKEAGVNSSAMVHLIGQLAVKGNINSVLASGTAIEDAKFQDLKAKVVATMQGTYAPAVKAPAASTKITSAQASKVVDQVYAGNKLGMTSDTTAMTVFAMEGKPGKVKSFDTKGDKNLEALKAGLLSAMNNAALPEPPQTRAVTAAQTVNTPKAGTLPASAFDNIKLPDSNSNAKSHNPKVDLIKQLHDAGDEKGILALNYGSNTYAGWQVKIANDALASMGSVHQVSKKQAANSHPALIGGTAQTGQEPVVKPKPSGKVAAKPDPIYRIPNSPDFANWNGAGKGLSSHAVFNKQNDELTDAIHAAGKSLDVQKLKDLTYQPIDQTGAPVGAPIHVSGHKSKHVVAYYNDVLEAMQNPYVPPKKMTAEEFQQLPTIIKDVVAGIKDVPKLQDAAEVIGRYGVVGAADVKKFDGYPPKQLTHNGGSLSVQSLYDQSRAGFDKLTHVEQQAIKDYTGSGYTSMNDAVTGKPSAKAKVAIKGMDQAAVELPAGTILSRKFSFSSEAEQKKFEGSVGKIVKDFGIISTATKPSTWSGEVQLRITAAPGVKGLYVAPNPKTGGQAISKNPGENEIILNYGTKFLVTKVTKKAFKDDAGTWGQYSQVVVDVIALPEPFAV